MCDPLGSCIYGHVREHFSVNSRHRALASHNDSHISTKIIIERTLYYRIQIPLLRDMLQNPRRDFYGIPVINTLITIPSYPRYRFVLFSRIRNPVSP